jgi:hypothetical protein
MNELIFGDITIRSKILYYLSIVLQVKHENIIGVLQSKHVNQAQTYISYLLIILKDPIYANL